jgi:NhaP-type Na+/H+ or K+/H+ antiporter
MLVFLLNAFLFILVGLEFPTILHAISQQSSIAVTSGYAALISLTLILVRLVWVVLTAYTPQWSTCSPIPGTGSRIGGLSRSSPGQGHAEPSRSRPRWPSRSRYRVAG